VPDRAEGAGEEKPAHTADSADPELGALRRLISRERIGRREAEDLLEFKSRELYEFNQSLEARVRERTTEVGEANTLLRQEAETRAAAQQLLSENEERFRSVVNHVVDGIITIDKSGIIDSINPAAENLFGYSAGELRGQNVSSLMPSPDADRHDQYLERYLRTGEARIIGIGREVVAKRRDGSIFDMELSLSEYMQGPRRMFVGITRDMTERNRVAADLRAAKESAELASQAKSDFLAKMSHELRTPMSAILGYADLVLAGETTAVESADFVERMRVNTIHLLALIDDLLDLTKVEAQQVNIKRERTSVSDLIDEVAALMGGKADQKSLDFRVDHRTALPASVATDPLRYRQVVINLIGNAIKYTAAGSVVVTTEASRLPEDRVRITIEVRDTGEGIPAESLEQIFEPFVQIRTGRTSAEGTGLGLGIARQIARLLGGDVEVKSEIGVGTTFRFFIEVDDESDFAEPTAKSTAAANQSQDSSAKSGQLAGLRVLLVEDAPDNRLILTRFLERGQMHVSTAENGEEGVNQVLSAQSRGEPFDVILMDMMMPVLDGYSATRKLREAGVATPVIALTAQAMAEDQARSLAAGCDDYLSKPVRPDQLYSTISGQLTIG
jgi:PAS domain S-box-containing protein